MQKPTATHRTTQLHYAYIVLTLCVLAVFGSLGLGRLGYSIILPPMQDALKLSNTQTGELQSWNLVGYSLTVLFAGMIAARYGARVLISLSLCIGGLAMLATGAFPYFDIARGARFFTGVGNAGANVPAMGLVSSWFGPKRRGLASGIAAAGVSVGLIVTGPLVPAIVAQSGAEGWRVSWYVTGAITLAISALCLLFLRNQPAEMGLAPIGETNAPSAAQASASALDWGLVYKSRLLWQLAAIYFAFGFAYIIYATFFVRYLVKEAGFASANAGALWFQVGVVSAFSGLLWGGISDRWGRRATLITVFVIEGVAYLAFGLSRDPAAIYFSAILFALTAWSIPTLMGALAGDLFGARLAPAALGLMTVIFGTGQAIGPYLAGIIADATLSFSSAFVLAGVVALTLGAGGSLTLRAIGTLNDSSPRK